MGWFNGIEFGLLLGAFVAFFIFLKLAINCMLDDYQEKEEIELERRKKENFNKLLKQTEGLWK